MKLFSKIRSANSKLSLKFKIWMYFVTFTIFVFVLLWTFQILFLERFYESMKTKAASSSADRIASCYSQLNDGDIDSSEFRSRVESIAIDNDLCVEILDRYERPSYSVENLGDCLIHGRENTLHPYILKIIGSDDKTIRYTMKNPRSGYDMLLYGRTLGDPDNPSGFLLVNSALVPVGSTVDIIKRQLMLITIVLIIMAFIISLFLSRRIARPIANITKSAENLAKGDFNTKFDGKGYLEAKKLADTLTYAESELSRVDTMQRDLIANVSHDLRTPLTMLKAYAEMIRDLSGDNPVKRNEHLEIIIDETDRLSLMVNDILEFSKLESGKQKLNPSEFEICGKLSEIIDRFKGISEKMGYHIRFTADEPRIVCCDVVKIEQVIYNLINNAINYTGKDKQVFVRQINTDDGVLIEVEDTGDGIEEDKIKLIFDKYYRSENHKREVVGTGLGLSIVKAVLKMHNYDYGVRSTLGKGSTFWFKISDVK